MKQRRLSIRLLSVFFAVLILIGTFGIIPVSAANETTKVNLKLGNELRYDSAINWTTHMMYADGKMAYCVNPRLPAPSGTFATTAKNLTELSTSSSNYKLLQKALYYGYGGDGFEKSVNVFTTTNTTYSGNTMSAFMGNLKEKYWLGASSSDLHYLLTHRVLANIYGDSDWDYALSSDWKSAVTEIVNALKKAPNAPNTTTLFVLDPQNGGQKVILAKQLIKLQLQKTSANTSLTNNNSCYSLEGAKYNIYLDNACKEYFGYIKTNAQGFGKYGGGDNGVNVPLQTYYAKEVEAPKGYALDKTVYEFKKSSKTADGVVVYSFSCKDIPQNDPVNILLTKTDENGKGLANAEFTISYYKQFFETVEEANKYTPERSWIFKTDENGVVQLDKNPKYFVSGDDFYYATNSGNPALPLGTITIQETKAPNGFVIDDTVRVRQIKSDDKYILNF